MGFFSKLSPLILLSIAISLLFVPARTHDEGFISVVVSNQGLDFVKGLLIKQAISSMIPLQLSQIDESVQIPVIGKVHVVLSDITIYRVNIASSYVKTGEMGIVLVASGATANLSMKWWYSYRAWLIEISDHGRASVEVENMEVGVTFALKDQEGTLSLSLLESWCHVNDISIKLEGGESWLYQVLVDAFEGRIRSAIEDAISKKIREGMLKLDSVLQSIPKDIKINDIAAMNVTFVDSPALSNSSAEFEINGLFVASEDSYLKKSLDLVFCNDPAKMVEISLHENVFNSFSSVFFNENHMRWTVKKLPDQSLLNTTRWRYIVPQLYKQYPDDAMELNISASSQPKIEVDNNEIDLTIQLDVIIDVMDAAEIIPIACISLEISASCAPKIIGNKLVFSLQLKDFTSVLKWSRIENLHIRLVQCVMSVVIKNIILPHANLYLLKGLPLPVLHGFVLENADILCTDSRIVICSDVAFAEQQHLTSKGVMSS